MSFKLQKNMLHRLFIFVIICILSSCPSVIRAKETKCGEACHETKPDRINVHLIPHTHDDVGWLKTVDQYYYGSNKVHAPFGVQYILDSVISELHKNEDRRFVYVETSFFWAWWEDLDDNGKVMVHELVKKGRLEFLHGGWCMSDEASPHYTSMIDQMTFGLKFLNETFGECGRPSVSWQIDPFGHSSEVALEFAEMGFNALFVGRIDFEDYKTRKTSKSLESIWRPDPSLGEAGDLFTSVLFDLYQAPSGFCFDTYCSDEPIMDNKRLHGYNVDLKIRKFEEHMDRYQSAYKTKHVLVTMGGDFTYTSASSWFKNMDKLIKYTNNMSETLHVLYSTPSCYLNAVHSTNTTWPTKESDDYFPYGDDEHSYWTGYYTSRPAVKYFVYLANNILQAAKQLATVLGSKFELEEFEFKRSVSIAQHHDAVSGTEKQHVADDYSTYIQEGINNGQKLFSESYKQLYGSKFPDLVFGNLRNISQFKLSEDHQHFIISIYNPSTIKKTVPVKFPVLKDNYYQIYNSSGAILQTDLVPIPLNLNKVLGRKSNATHDLVFIAPDVPALGIVNFYVQASQAAPAGSESTIVEQRPVNNSFVFLDNGKIQLAFNKTDGLLTSIKKNGTIIPFHQNFYSYTPMKGYNYNADTRASGAYIFRPIETVPKTEFNNATLTEYVGKNVFEIHQQFSSWLSQIVRLYKDSEDVEFEWLIGPLPIGDWIGKELVTRYTTDIASNSTFYTDSNGRRWMKRIRNYRKYWNTNVTEPVSSNYYPLTTSICLKDNLKQLTVIIDRPEGGTSLNDGELEIMLHRRLLYDDNKGVVEPLDELAFSDGLIIRGKHVIQINNLKSASDAHRFKAVETAFKPVTSFAKTSIEVNDWLHNYNQNFSLLATELSPNVHILTLERWRKNEILLRLEHLFQTNETSTYASSAVVDIKKMFSFFEVNHIQELTLAANLPKDKLKRKKWIYDGQLNKKVDSATNSTELITLQPMQIRTFILTVEPKSPSFSYT